MIEKEIEQAVLEAVSSLAMDGLDIDGIWQKSPDGRAKGSEDPNARAILRVVAAPRRFDAFSSPKVNVPVSIALSVRMETAPDGEALSAYTRPLFDLLQEWQLSVDAVKNEFTTMHFSPFGIRVDGGDIGFSGEPRNCWTITQKFTLRGVVRKG